MESPATRFGFSPNTEGNRLFCAPRAIGAKRIWACGGEAATSFSGAHSRRAAGPKQPGPGAFCSRTQDLFEANAYQSVYSQEPHTKAQNFFHLNCVPRQGENRLFCRMVGFILAKAGRKRTILFFGILK
jgi:hypothetical protein